MEKQFNPFSLNDKIIVISGAASGIGRQCAITCSRMRAKLILLDLNETGLKETIQLVENSSEHFSAVINLTDYEQVEKIISSAVEKWEEFPVC